jgi:hypothetical protein
VDGDECVAGIVLSREHVPELHGCDSLFDSVERGGKVAYEGFILEFRSDLYFFGDVLRLGVELFETPGPGFVFVQLLQDAVGFLLVVPEIRSCGDLFKVANLLFPLVDVKDTPLAGRVGG